MQKRNHEVSKSTKRDCVPLETTFFPFGVHVYLFSETNIGRSAAPKSVHMYLLP